MFKINDSTLTDRLNIIWTIASKDIVDALKNRVVVRMVIMLSVMLLVPKMLPLIFEQSQMVLPIFDQGESNLPIKLQDNTGFLIQKIHSDQEFRSALCGSVYPEIGLLIPPNFDQNMAAGGQIEFQGYGCWSKRFHITELMPKIEESLSQSLGLPVTIHIKGNIVYPPSSGVLSLSLATINSALMILIMGIFLVPSLLHEEKESKTMQALLVSPASIGQVLSITSSTTYRHIANIYKKLDVSSQQDLLARLYHQES